MSHCYSGSHWGRERGAGSAQASLSMTRMCSSQFLRLRSFPQGTGLGHLEIRSIFTDLIHRWAQPRGRALPSQARAAPSRIRSKSHSWSARTEKRLARMERREQGEGRG